MTCPTPRLAAPPSAITATRTRSTWAEGRVEERSARQLLAVTLLVHYLGDGLTRLAGPPASGPFVRVAKGDRGAHRTILGDAEDLPRRLPAIPDDPTHRRAHPVRQGGQHYPFGEPPLVIGLLRGPLPRHHQHDAQRSIRQMMRVALHLRQCSERLPVPDHHDLPRLAVGGAARPARHLEDVVHDLLRHRVGAEAADGPQGTEKGDAVLGDHEKCSFQRSNPRGSRHQYSVTRPAIAGRLRPHGALFAAVWSCL